jgi:NAD(P)-dependent dehydrogenase (short-subunit alcohol dehydrogenase family)
VSTTYALEGTGALVTGGGSGIGLAVATRLAADGATVTICGRSTERLEAAVEHAALPDGPGSLHAIAADVTDEAAIVGAVRAAEDHAGGPLSSVVANAGGSTSIGPVTQLGLDEWTATTTLNLTGTMLALKHGAASLVRGGGGSFVAISSTAGSLVHPWFGAYGPAKAGINQLCRQAADELGPSWVRVNAVCPGLIRTDMVELITAGGPVLDSYTENTPISRVGEPEDIAALVRFLVGSESAWLTGQVISVDGGQSLRRGPSLAGVIEPLFGSDGLRGVVADPI